LGTLWVRAEPASKPGAGTRTGAPLLEIPGIRAEFVWAGTSCTTHVTGEGMDRPRDVYFDALKQWLGGGWETCPHANPRLRHLRGLVPKTADEVESMEAEFGGRFPVDLRRTLLEVGDVGPALFREPLSALQVHPGEWRWTASHECSLGADRKGFFAGGMFLGVGGGGDSSKLVLVINGPGRGQVWVTNGDDDVWRLQPLAESYWAGVAGSNRWGPSDLVAVMMIASSLPVSSVPLPETVDA